MTMAQKKHQDGFTLLEIIIAVVITAILSALALQVMGTNIQRSAAPLANVRSSLSLQEVMENITADYKRLFIEDSAPMIAFQNHISYNNSNDDGLYWTPATAFSASVVAIQFSSSAGGCDATAYPGGCFKEAACTQDCNIYRVTITQSSTGRSLSALFTE
jgi:prepilin-type N-terminal cleavage/methylation domain-containing protein